MSQGAPLILTGLARDLGLTPFRPRLPWVGPDLQTMRNLLMGHRPDLSDFPQERHVTRMPDGDQLISALNLPTQPAPDAPLVVIVHGMTGCADSRIVSTTALCHLKRGWPVLRLNLRGAGPSRAVCQGAYHAGSSADIAAVLADVPPELRENGMVGVGFSLGGALLLKHLGETGAASGLRAAASVSAPLDLAASELRLRRRRNWIYRRELLRDLKAQAVDHIGRMPAARQRAVRAARNIAAFDTHFTTAFTGHTDAARYYEDFAPLRYLAGIETPTLVVHALDDPWIAPAPYRALAHQHHPHISLALSRKGGHVGFHGRHDTAPWHDRAVTAFFERVIGPELTVA